MHIFDKSKLLIIFFMTLCVLKAYCSSLKVGAKIINANICLEIPSHLKEREAKVYNYVGRGRIYFAPSIPNAEDEIFIFLQSKERRDLSYQIRARYTHDNWVTTREITMNKLCVVVDHLTLSRQTVWMANLGQFAQGKKIEFAVNYRGLNSQRAIYNLWFNNGGDNYRFKIGSDYVLERIENTHFRIDDVPISDNKVLINQFFSIYVQTYPINAARRVYLHWWWYKRGKNNIKVNKSQSLMDHDYDYVGPSAQNSQWKVDLPMPAFAEETMRYKVVAHDKQGNVISSPEYSFTPKSTYLAFIGGFGLYKPLTNKYQEGPGLFFGADYSTSLGCNTHNISVDKWSIRAVKVFVPNFTDLEYQNQMELKAAARQLVVEVWTNATYDDKWSPYKGHFAKLENGHFIYTFFHLSDLCPFSYALIPRDGQYGYKIRATINRGKSWFWRGSENGPGGGKNLIVNYLKDGSYFNY